jgi:hypothetical protein
MIIGPAMWRSENRLTTILLRRAHEVFSRRRASEYESKQ